MVRITKMKKREEQKDGKRTSFGKYFKPVQFRGRLIRIQNVATKTGCTPRQRHTIRRGNNTMKKTVSVCMTAVMALSLLAGGAVQALSLIHISEPTRPY